MTSVPSPEYVSPTCRIGQHTGCQHATVGPPPVEGLRLLACGCVCHRQDEDGDRAREKAA